MIHLKPNSRQKKIPKSLQFLYSLFLAQTLTLRWRYIRRLKKKQNKNATSHENIGSLKTAIEEEYSKMSEEFILNSFLFQAIQFSSTVLFQTILFSISIVFIYRQLYVKKLYFKQFSWALEHSLALFNP